MGTIKPKIWTCKIGETHPESIPTGADAPMRRAVAAAYVVVTGQRPAFIFSGWDGELDESERAVHENRLPSDEWARQWHQREAAAEMFAALKGLIPLIEMDAEASDPRTGLWAALHMAREAIRKATP